MREEITKLADVTCEDLNDSYVNEMNVNHTKNKYVSDMLDDIENVTSEQFQKVLFREIMAYIGHDKALEALEYVLDMHGVSYPKDKTQVENMYYQ